MSVSTNCGSKTQWSNPNTAFDLQLYQRDAVSYSYRSRILEVSQKPLAHYASIATMAQKHVPTWHHCLGMKTYASLRHWSRTYTGLALQELQRILLHGLPPWSDEANTNREVLCEGIFVSEEFTRLSC
jgi:hypothetical protein